MTPLSFEIVTSKSPGSRFAALPPHVLVVSRLLTAKVPSGVPGLGLSHATTTASIVVAAPARSATSKAKLTFPRLAEETASGQVADSEAPEPISP